MPRLFSPQGILPCCSTQRVREQQTWGSGNNNDNDDDDEEDVDDNDVDDNDNVDDDTDLEQLVSEDGLS